MNTARGMTWNVVGSAIGKDDKEKQKRGEMEEIRSDVR